jgi:hypothetical protein
MLRPAAKRSFEPTLTDAAPSTNGRFDRTATSYDAVLEAPFRLLLYVDPRWKGEVLVGFILKKGFRTMR